MVARLRTHRAEQEAIKRDVGAAYVDWGYVFAQANGNPIHVNTVARRHARLIAAAGVPYIRPHDLRHASATLGLESGESLKDVSDRLGHASVSITADYYLHPSEERQRENADRLATYLRLHAMGTTTARDQDGTK
jgi:integrase